MLRRGCNLLRRRPSLPPHMIPLHTYAQHVYQHAPAATTEHLRHTVWAPLGLAADTSEDTDGKETSRMPHVSLYAAPPITTNIRCVGADVRGEMRKRLNTGPEEVEGAAARYAPPFTLDELGLPFCACVQPRIEDLCPLPPALASTTSSGESSPTAAAPAAAAVGRAEGPVVVVVDAGAAEAVLRGSDLYAPGIITASRVFVAGEAAVVAFYVQRVAEDGEAASPQQQQQQTTKKWKREATVNGDITAAPATASLRNEEEEAEGGAKELEPADTAASPLMPSCTQWRIVSSLTAGVTLPAALYDVLPSETADLAHRRHFLVCVASGTLLMGWKDVLGRRTHGIALRTAWSPQQQPSRATLRRLLGIAAATTAAPAADDSPLPDPFFLQNYSSMVPVSLLVDHLPPVSPSRPRSIVLDACAAPGGKTSLLLSLLAARAPATSAVADNFRVVCCERSRPRQAQLMTLLHEHLASVSDAFLSRVLEPHCVDTNKYLKQLLTDAGCGKESRAATDTFDAILLDPPCTGLGLRPKLLPHIHTVATICQSADYQRKLFDSCVRHLRGTPSTPGVIVYSTCTTSREENEANVLHFLRSYPGLRVARASTPAHDALCALSVTNYPMLAAGKPHEGKERSCSSSSTNPLPSAPSPSPQLLLASEILAVQLEREAALAAAATAATPSVPIRQDAPLLALRFMPRPLVEYGDVCEDSVGFFVAVFFFHGHEQLV